MTTISTPLPCPFCGHEPEVYPIDPKNQGHAWGAVVCLNRSCPTYRPEDEHGVRIKDRSEIRDFNRSTDEYRQAAIEWWNERGGVSATQARQIWIDEMMNIYGFVAHHHLCKKFGISADLAAGDLALFHENNRERISYDQKAKHYVQKRRA